MCSASRRQSTSDPPAQSRSQPRAIARATAAATAKAKGSPPDLHLYLPLFDLCALTHQEPLQIRQQFQLLSLRQRRHDSLHDSSDRDVLDSDKGRVVHVGEHAHHESVCQRARKGKAQVEVAGNDRVEDKLLDVS
jgi:hypothetical protein